MTLRRRRIEQVIATPAAARPDDAPLATLARLLEALAERRWRRGEQSVLVGATIAANGAAAASWASLEGPAARGGRSSR